MRIGFSGFNGQLHYNKTTGEVRLTGTLNDDPKDDTFKLLMPKSKKFNDHHHHANKRHAKEASEALHDFNKMLGLNKIESLSEEDQLRAKQKLLKAQQTLMDMFVHKHLIREAVEDVLSRSKNSEAATDRFFAVRFLFMQQHNFVNTILDTFKTGISFFNGPIETCITNYTLPDISGLKLVEKSAGKNKADKNKVGKNKTVQRTIEMDICLKDPNT
ncbi:MAG: hypothetical protein QE263_04190 [Vampirovibrionales bacterium]|nr:hypothetical protein [Vampirovibrionales bacterium]